MAERFLPTISFGDDARSKLLDAGWEMMAAADGSILEAGFNPERIASEAGVSRRTFYRYFPDKYEYSLAMFSAVLGRSYSEAAAQHIQEMPDYDLGDMFEVLRQSSQHYWNSIGLNETLLARVSLLTLAGNSPGVLDSARQSYNASIDMYVPMWDALFEAWDIELRPPWTTARFAAFSGALVDGMVLRRLYDPEGFDEMLADVSCALTPMLFRLRGDTISGLDDVADRFADEVRRRWTEHQDVEVSLSNSKNIYDALVKLLGQRGLKGTTIEAVATEAGLSLGTVRAKGTIEEQVCRGARDLLGSIEDELVFDMGSEEIEGPMVIDRHDQRIRILVAENRSIFQALLEVRVTGRGGELYKDVFVSLTSAASRAKNPKRKMDADSIIAYAEQAVVSVLFNWESRQKPGL